MDSIIFDLDGTLWNATEGIKDTWNEVLKNYPNIREPITTEELEGCMGLLLDDISRRLFPKESSNKTLLTVSWMKLPDIHNTIALSPANVSATAPRKIRNSIITW